MTVDGFKMNRLLRLVTPALRWRKQEDLEFEASLEYKRRSCLKQEQGWGV
jgi:hypothetical protein